MTNDDVPPDITRRAFVGAMAVAPFATALAPRRTHATREHAVVIGAGAFGGWSALALRRAGFRVTLVDAWGAGNSRASSGGETRVIRAVYNGKALYTQMAARSLHLWRKAERDFGQRLYHKTGALWMCADDDSYVRKSIEPMRMASMPLEQLAPNEARRRFPHMGFDDVRVAYFEPEAGYLSARVACEVVRQRAVAEGVMYRAAWVQPGEKRGGRLVDIQCSDGSRIGADHFVFACGPWMGTVFPEVVGRRIVPTRQEVFFFGTPAGDTRYEPGTTPVWMHIGKRLVYGVPNHERRGLKVADDTAGDEVDPSRLDRVPSAAGLALAREIVGARFPALKDAPLVESRVCQYEASTDGDYLIDRHPGLTNTWLVGGGSGHGFKMGPAIGEHVAALVSEKELPHREFAYARLEPRPAIAR
ncbi:MAG: dependent oxidoreductase [Gemmatimonadetes bacterium]|nr:dependent oxidoreductase [Gemmatimonadota bacterium]